MQPKLKKSPLCIDLCNIAEGSSIFCRVLFLFNIAIFVAHYILDYKLIKRITEQASKYRHLEKMSALELLKNINAEDATVASKINHKLHQIAPIIDVVTKKLKNGGRLFYIGAGTSGRLGVVDASECPPTFGVPHNMVIGLIAGGDSAIRKAVEFAEDDNMQGWKDLQTYQINNEDFVIGLAASGTTPYVVGAIEQCALHNILTACITCNENTPLAKASNHPIEIIVGPEFVTGSTRMKAGTAQKLVLNMISTAVMIRLGRVVDNKMVDMQLSNDKLVERGAKMVMQALNINFNDAKKKLLQAGSVRSAIDNYLINEQP